MPRILRNYLISFAVIGIGLGIIHLIDLYFVSDAPQSSSGSAQSQSTPSPKE